MAKVPTYDVSQVEERAVPGVRRESIETPEFVGGAANTQIAIGAGEMAAGSGLDAIAYHMQQKEDLRLVQDASVEYGKRVLDWRLNAEKNRTGAGAVGATSDFSDFHKQTVEDITKNLPTSNQQQAFKTFAQKNGLAVRHDVGTFEIMQTRKAEADADSAGAKNFIDQGAVAITGEAVAAAKSSLVNSTAAYLATQNLAPNDPAYQRLMTDRLTAFHTQRIQQLAKDYPLQAEAYFNANQAEIAGSQRAEIGEFANKATAARIGGDVAQKIWDDSGVASNDKGVARIDQMAAQARKELKDNPHALAVALTTLHQLDADRDHAVAAEEVSSKARVWEQLMKPGATLAQAMQSPEWAKLKEPGKVQQEWQTYLNTLESRAASRASRANSEAGRAYTEEQRAAHRLHVAGMDTTLRLQDPDALMTMSRDEVVNLMPTLGPENTAHLVAKYDAFKKDGTKALAARVDNDQFNSFAKSLGLNPQGKLNEPQKAQITEVRNTIENIIENEQHIKRRLLNREEKDVIMKRELDNSVMLRNNIFTDDKVPAILLTKENKGRAYINIEGDRVMLDKIPDADYKKIHDSLLKRYKAAPIGQGVPVSDAEIARIYRLGRMQDSPDNLGPAIVPKKKPDAYTRSISGDKTDY